MPLKMPFLKEVFTLLVICDRENAGIASIFSRLGESLSQSHLVDTRQELPEQLASVLETFARQHFDAILVFYPDSIDSGMTDLPASFELLRQLRTAGCRLPIVAIVDDEGSFTCAREALESGASFYLSAQQLLNETLAPGVLNNVIQHTIQNYQAMEQSRKKYTEDERSKELFYAALAHDLKTPVIAEKKILAHLKSETFGPLNSAQHDVLQELINSNQYLFRMVSNLLTSYKYQHNRVQLQQAMTDYNQLLGNLVEEQLLALAREKGQQIQLSFNGQMDGQTSLLYIDAIEIQRVLFNLVQNALNYSPENTTIMIRTQLSVTSNVPVENDSDDTNKPETRQIKPKFLITHVEDHGPGIQSEQIPKLFQPYSTVKTLRHVGTGLGLYLSRQIVEAHGGYIGVNSKPGTGSSFYFALPVV